MKLINLNWNSDYHRLYGNVFQMCTLPLDGTLVREAEGLLVDMMADPDIPRHLVGGLRAVSQILKSTESCSYLASSHRTKASPSDDSLCPPDYSDLPYVDKPLYLPKVSHKSCIYLSIPHARCVTHIGLHV